MWTLDAEGGAINRGALRFEERCEDVWERATLDGSVLPGVSCGDVSLGGKLMPALMVPIGQDRSGGVK